jgi:flavin-binding protein dodecin
MKAHIYKFIELTGTSTASIEDAIIQVIERAQKTVKNLCWFQVVESFGPVHFERMNRWLVTLKVGFTVES